jgi:hypothetical protein
MTNLTTLSDTVLIERAVDYMNYLSNVKNTLNLSRTLLMDETAIYFEDCRTQTIDFRGRHHVVIKSTGYASMRITGVMSVWADGRKGPCMVIHKGAEKGIEWHHGGIMSCHQPRAWVNQDVIIAWINAAFGMQMTAPDKCIVWDSCRVHIAQKVKDYCHARGIKLVVIPGGLTPYLQAGDIGIYREFKDKISNLIDEWKNSGSQVYTRGGNPKPPPEEVVREWVRRAWHQVSDTNVKNSIKCAGFSDNVDDWHITRHDVYGEQFKTAWNNAGRYEIDPLILEDIPQEDEIDDVLEEILELSI